ncbi:AraC family transcriptional regulator [Ructibacterium gallinarum]|uniref:Helix-turn-helix transcriptional regulator n=1 Tax=Ructibacterium gallinarum TaxID=2779355 RepID=A0A9D5R9A8_9FIRM|nr:AraC family transcriptional regulator [Ructibacterium gallinarum]MBE5040299.1 helix-turn-helix transcriptional regulator [Ructibacterium gallinarum]
MEFEDIFGYFLIIDSAGHNVVPKDQGFFPADHSSQLVPSDDSYTFMMIARGNEIFYLNNAEPITLSEGDFFFFNSKSSPMRCNTHNETMENYYINFKCKNPQIFKKFQFQLNTIYHIRFTTSIAAKLESIILENFYFKGPFSGVSAVSYFINLLVSLHRAVYEKDQKQTKLSSDAVTKIAISMYTDSELNLSLDDYATMCGLSKYHFCREFKKQYGFSPIAFRNHIRVDNARTYLEATNFSVSKIATMVGFSNLSLFVNMFRSIYHMTPSEYRKSFQDGSNTSKKEFKNNKNQFDS